MIDIVLLAFLSAVSPASGRLAAASDSLAPVAARADSALATATAAPADSVHTLPEVRVESARPIEARRRMPTAFVTELSTGAAGRALETLSEVLSQAAGVRILQFGGLGAFSTVSLRGAPPGQVAVYLDGMPVTSAAHGVVNLSDLPVTAIERVEVYRGLSPLAWGPAMPGGAVNLVTATSPEIREVGVARGSFGTKEARASAGFRWARLAGLLHAGYQGTEGDFEFLDDNETSLNPDDDVTSVRINNQFDAVTARGTLSLAAPGSVEARLTGDHFDKHQGLPGRGADQASEARLEFRRSVARLEARRAAGGAWPGLFAGGALARERLGLSVHEFNLGLGAHESDDVFDDRGARLVVDWPELPLGLGVEAGAATREERAELHDSADGVADPPVSLRSTRAGHVGLRVAPLGERLVLHAAQRWDRIHDRLHWQTAFAPGSQDVEREFATPQLGVRMLAPLGLEARANWTDARRVPEFMELFGNQGATQGNPLLKPERAESWDAGLAWSAASGVAGGASLSVEWAHHESRSHDLIVFVRNSPNSSKAQNISAALIRGDELAARAAVPWGISAALSLTWQSAIDQGDVPFWHGKQLPQRPARQAYARIDWTRGALRAGADALHVGETFLDRYNLQPVPSRTLFGASLSLALFARQVRFVLEGKNLGDDRVSDIGGYPLPGRSLYLSCQARAGTTSHP